MVTTVLSPQEERVIQGEGITLTTEEARTKRVRVSRMLEGFRDKRPAIVVDRARLMVESFKETEGLPLVLRWAKALENVARKFPVSIGKDELIVGRCGPQGRYHILYPELAVDSIARLPEIALSQKGVPFVLTEENARVLTEELVPYWKGRTFYDSLVALMPEEIRRRGVPGVGRSSLSWCLDYEKVLNRGFNGIKREAEEKLASLDPFDPENNYDKLPFYKAVIIVCDAVNILARRYAELARRMAKKERNEERKKELLEIAEICEWVPANPARTFREAVQSQWLAQCFSRLEQDTGGVIGNGRIDQYLYPYYKKDKEEGRITDDEVLELLECLWLNMAQHVTGFDIGGNGTQRGSGFMHFEHTTIGGQTRDGRDASNELSYLILESKKEFPLNYPDLSVRIHSQTPEPFLLKVCELIKEGTGFPKLLNDEEIIPLFLVKGAGLEEARDYCGTGCTEVKMLNRDTCSSANSGVFPWGNLGVILEMALNDGRSRSRGDEPPIGVRTGDPRSFNTFDDVWNAFCLQLEDSMTHSFIADYIFDTVKPRCLAAPQISSLHDLCMEDGKDINEGKIKGGLSLPRYSIIGFGTAIDSLAAIKKLVYDDKKVTMSELLEALDTNFEGKEVLRQMCLNAPKYGNNDPYTDSIGLKIETFLTDLFSRHTTVYGGKFDLITVPLTAHVAFGSALGATPNGRRAGEALSEGISPSQGCDTRGPTTTLLSIASTKSGQAERRAARLLNMKISPQAVAGEDGTRNLASFIRTWCDMKFWHIQFNIINSETLIDAQKHPEKYRNLLVRVAGYSAYFVDLSPQLQSEIIARTEHQAT